MRKFFKSLFYLIYPGTLFFPIFWFPILIPLFTGVFAILIEVIIIANSGNGEAFTTAVIVDLKASAYATSQLAFLSTDIWALTTIISYAAKGKLNGAYVWGHSFAAIIGLFLHILLFLSMKFLATQEWFEIAAIISTIFGFIAVLWIRTVVYNYIEKNDFEAINETNA